MANDHPNFFRRIDSASRLGSSARIRLAYSSEVLTDYQSNSKIVSSSVFQRGDNWLLDIDSSFSESEGSFAKKLDVIGYQVQNSVKILIDEEALSLEEFSRLFFAYLEHRNLYVEIILNNGRIIRLDNIQVDFNYSYVKNIATENIYEITLRQAKAISKSIDIVKSITWKDVVYPLAQGGNIAAFNIFVETIGDENLYEVLVGSVDDIDLAKVKSSFTFIIQDVGGYFLYVRIKNSVYYQRFYLDINNNYTTITTL